MPDGRDGGGKFNTFLFCFYIDPYPRTPLVKDAEIFISVKGSGAFEARVLLFRRIN